MSDILKQIQALQEQFSNLFEVEGLGNPAVDVPPSQNKIKKDVKTKDGKAELVSVEDELFPYDGNKREQYRQKILDTINGMIQGTSTLEDLLQIVRQKKAPLKEAMELMEDTISYIKKQEQPILKKGRANALRKLSNNSELKNKFKKLGKEDAEMVSAAFNSKKDQEKLEKLGSLRRKAQDVKMKDWQQMGNPRRKTKNEIGAEKTEARRYGETYREDKGYDRVDTDEPIPYHIGDSKGYPHYEEPKSDKQRIKDSIARHEKKNSLKEAFDIMEEIINELHPDTVKSALHAHNKKTLELEDKVNKRIGEIFKKHGIKGNTYSAATAENRQKAAETEKEIKEDPEIKDLHDQQEKRAKKNELYRNAIRKARKSPVEEALEIVQSLVEATPFETKRRIADKFKDKAMDMYNKAAEEDMENSKKKVELHKKIHQQGGDVPAFAEDKIDSFSDKPEVRKEQEEYNKLVDNGKKSGERVHKMNNFVNLVNYYKTPKTSEEKEKRNDK